MGRKVLLHGEVNLDLEDNARLAEVARAWFTQAAARLFPRLQQLADQGAPEVDSGITFARTMDDKAKSRPYSPERWQAVLDELDKRPSAVVFDLQDAHAEMESLLVRVDMYYGTTDGRWIRLTVDVVALEDEVNDPGYCRSWVEFFHAVLDPADPALGYVTDDHRFPRYTSLDLVMRRVFRVLAPVLPVGTPRRDPDHPHARVVYEDAGDYAG